MAQDSKEVPENDLAAVRILTEIPLGNSKSKTLEIDALNQIKANATYPEQVLIINEARGDLIWNIIDHMAQDPRV